MLDPLSEKDWRDLLRLIHDRQVIPVVGPGLVTVLDSATGLRRPVSRQYAPALARELGLAEPDSFLSWNDVARAHLLRGGNRSAVYNELRELLDRVSRTEEPSPALRALAGILDFDLLICTTPDDFLGRALERERPGFSRAENVIRFHPNRPKDLPTEFSGPLLLHILGNANTYPDFAVWEEDYMEFVCGLLENTDTLENLFQVLTGRHLLLLGSPAEDWIVRFFLRVARQQRLSDRSLGGRRDYLADHESQLGEPMILFFDQAVKATRVVAKPPEDFVSALAGAWHATYGAAKSDQEFLARMPEEIPRNAVFLSYSHADHSAAVQLARALEQVRVPIWMDRMRLQVGANYERNLEHQVKDACSFFISLISRATEAAPDRYVHRERRWAAQRHVDGFVFYLPLVLDLEDGAFPHQEPECFRKTHLARWSSSGLPAFALKIRHLVDEFHLSGRPKG